MTVSHPDHAEWEAWRPEDAADRLTNVQVPWYVAGGWAIDLYLGDQRREHDDLELGVPASGFAEIAAALDELEFHVVKRGLATPVAEAGDLLETVHQTWGLDRGAEVWRVDVFREPSAAGEWVSRRDTSIRLAYADLIEHTPSGIPYARPEVVLLFKAKDARPKDESDLAAVLPRLGRERRQLLAAWIGLVHPAHFWLQDL